jgi:phage baseplate assembly protein W
MTSDPLAVQRERALGWSLAMPEIAPGVDLGRDVSLVAGPNGLDFARVKSMDALNQSLSIALTTLLGADVFNRSFGFDGLNALVEETNPIAARERVRIGVIKVLRKDNRVRRIVDVNLEGNDRLEVPPAGSRVLDVRVVFEAITGDQAAMSLGGVG